MTITPNPTPIAPPRIVLLHKAGAAPDEQLARTLEVELAKRGCAVFVDRQTRMDLSWAKEIGEQIRAADTVVALVSPASAESEFFVSEIETSHEASQNGGRPIFLTVRVGGFCALNDSLEALVTAHPNHEWHGPDDTLRVLGQIEAAARELPARKAPIRLTISKGLRLSPRPTLKSRPPIPVAPPTPTATPARGPLIEPTGGAVPVTSDYYVQRQADLDLQQSLIRYDSIILIKGARQMGKTSMLARGLQFARERGAKVVLTDYQKFNATNFESVGAFYLSLAESLADQLELDVLPSDTWDERRGPNANFERFMRREVLGRLNAPLVWGLDEVDRLFTTTFGSEVFGLFRSWHNERALEPSGPWGGLTLVIAYATEAHLFITDMNQSPFNIGTRLALDDFSRDQVADLNRRYNSPLKTDAELDRFMKVVGGHPFLVRRGLYEIAAKARSLDAFEATADLDDGIFGEHLRRILVLLGRDPKLTDALRIILQGRGAPSAESFYRLRSAGIISGASEDSSQPRCQLYARYLTKHLL